MKTLQFTLGPVQGFVAQARRTRDLWAGSFLLSYLSGHAMSAVLAQGGEILKPVVTDAQGAIRDPLLQAIVEKRSTGPQIGSLPNQFKASVPDTFDPELCARAVRGEWEKIAGLVWKTFVHSVAATYGSQGPGETTEEIWKRQVKNFWEIAWVIGTPGASGRSENTWLDARKNWRSHYPPIEGGEHGTIMGDWQEISGHLKTHTGDGREGQDARVNLQKQFWAKLRDVKGVSVLDLSEHERLSAVSLVKRLYPKPEVARQAFWELDVKNWPSSSYMAAADWIRDVYPHPHDPTDDDKRDNKQLCDAYVALVEASLTPLEGRADIFSEYATELQGLSYTGKFGKLDGGFYFDTALENPRTVPFARNATEDDEAKAARRQVIAGLHTLYKGVGSKPSPYFALLAADGDRLGALIRVLGKDQHLISEALARFSAHVPEVINVRNMGVTIYAGGDDVLALLPLSRAIGAARQLRQQYAAAFRDTCSGHSRFDEIMRQATLSAATVFANQRITKRAVLAEARYMLDEVAKDQNGRDSLAVSVLTGGGRSVAWTSTWKDDDNDTELSVATTLSDLSTVYAAHYSRSFFHHFRDRFAALLDEQKRAVEGLPAQAIFTAEYMKNRDRPVPHDEASERVARLLKVCFERRRQDGRIIENENKVLVDGALLVRFLITKGLEA